MPGQPWGEDGPDDEARIANNVNALLQRWHDETRAGIRTPPRLEQAHEWHRTIYAGTSSPPKQSYLGTPRGTDDGTCDLDDYEVVLANGYGHVVAQGVPAAEVADYLDAFYVELRTRVGELDGEIAPGQVPSDTASLFLVVELCAWAHGEWVRIHPYANGNGRTARAWANWLALRYGLPPFVMIKPRPKDSLYAAAAHRSMGKPPAFTGDHSLTTQVFLDLLGDWPAAGTRPAR